MYLILIALLLSPFYLWKSGLPQLSHFLAAVAVGYRYTISKPKLIYFERTWIAQLFFLAYAGLVAVLVYINYSDYSTLMAPLYYIFGFLVFIEIVTIYIERGEKFLVYILYLHLVILLAIAILSVMGVGRIASSNEVRMMFAFNNPNQMASWAIWTVIIISTTGRAVYRSWLTGLLALVFASALIFTSLSRSGFVGIAVLLLFYLLIGLNKFKDWYFNHRNQNVKKLVLIVFILLLVLMILIFVFMTIKYLDSATTGISELDRIINRILGTDLHRQLHLRGYDRLWEYPQYLFFGAGEGARARFAEKTSYVMYEIHSSWAGLLFNYGLVGFILFASFILSLLKKINLIWFRLILLAPFLFGFSNYNVRNWYFWVGLAVVYSSALLVQECEGGGQKNELVDVIQISGTMHNRVKSKAGSIFRK